MATTTDLQYAFRTQKTIGICAAEPSYGPLPDFARPEGNFRCCAYSPCGRLFGWASVEAVCVVDTATGLAVTTLPLANVLELGFSPRGTFLITWERPAKDESGDATKNLKVWHAVEEGVDPANKQPLGRWVQKSQGGWNLQYTADEMLCARMVSNEIHFHESHDLSTVWNRLRVEGVAEFAIAPGASHSVAVFVPERKGAPAAVQVFNVPQFAAAVSQKTFFKGDKVQLKWNKQGTSILVLAQTEVDKTNKSYYGETALYLLSAGGGFDARVTLDKEGPIYDIAWSPNSNEFGVVYGYMPSKATIFDHRAAATHSFPIGPRNTVIFSPTGRFALVAGFGNLAGQIDVYDLEKDYRKVCTIESGNPSVCQWSPDSRFIMTATTSPRLRVDNGIKIWHVAGELMFVQEMVELYSVVWRPGPPLDGPPPAAAGAGAGGGNPLAPVPRPHESAAAHVGTQKTPSKAVGAYRPPGARGLATPLHFKREDEGGAAHTVGPAPAAGFSNGFGRGRRAVPGAEPADPAGARNGPGRAVPGAEPVGDGDNLARGRAKKKKNKRKEGEEAVAAAAGGASLAPPPPTANRGDADSSDLGNSGNGDGGGSRSTSRNNTSRMGRAGAGAQPHDSQQPKNGTNGRPAPSRPGARSSGDGVEPETTTADGLAEPGFMARNRHPQVRKIRSLFKKIRAIEELEMRLASGDKLEETQMKKIHTKAAVQKELEELERDGGGGFSSQEGEGGGGGVEV